MEGEALGGTFSRLDVSTFSLPTPLRYSLAASSAMDVPIFFPHRMTPFLIMNTATSPSSATTATTGTHHGVLSSRSLPARRAIYYSSGLFSPTGLWGWCK